MSRSIQLSGKEKERRRSRWSE